MKNPNYHSLRRPQVDSTMTPMIDVIFLLQIFFLCTAGFAIPELILPTELPDTPPVEAKAIKKPVDLETVRVRLRTRDGALAIALNGRPVAGLDQLSAELGRIAAVSADVPVILDIARDVPVGDVVSVYDRCLATGLVKINFAASKR